MNKNCMIAALLLCGVFAVTGCDSDCRNGVCSQEEAQVAGTTDDHSEFVTLAEAVPDAILEIRYYSTYNFVGDRIDGYEEPVALLTKL